MARAEGFFLKPRVQGVGLRGLGFRAIAEGYRVLAWGLGLLRA